MKISYGKHFPVGCPNKLMGNFHLFSLNLDPLLFLPTAHLLLHFLTAPCSSCRTKCTVSDCAIELLSWSYCQMEFTLVIGGGHVAYASYVCTALHLAIGLWTVDECSTQVTQGRERGRGKGGADWRKKEVGSNDFLKDPGLG